jgi:hypothetical protein
VPDTAILISRTRLTEEERMRIARGGRVVVIYSVIVLLATAPAVAARSFLDSNDYRSDDAVVGALLTDDDYAKMIADVVHLEGKLDWAWVPGLGSARKLESLGFSVDDYSSVLVQSPTLHTEEGGEWLPDRAHEVLMIGCQRLGWKPADDGDLVLATAIVGATDADGFGPVKFFNATNRHSIVFEFRLTDAGSGETRLVAREQVDSANMVGAIWRGVTRLVQFLSDPQAPRYARYGKSVSIGVVDMPGDKKTHKFEKYADPQAILAGAVRSSEIFDEVVDDPADTDYVLDVRFSEANIVGAYQTTANLLGVYVLKDRRSGEVVAEEEIATSTTISAREIGSGGKRLKATTSGAFLDSADSFLFRLAATLDSNR